MRSLFHRKQLRWIPAFFAFVVPASVSFAVPIPIPNYSFETPSANTVYTVSTAINNWTTFGDLPFDTGGGAASSGTGTFLNQKPDTTLYFPNADQNQVAYIFTKSGVAGSQDGLEQILTSTFQAGKSYDLSIYLALAGTPPGANDPFTFALFYYDPANPTARNVVASRTVFNDVSTGLSQSTLKQLFVSSPILSAGNVAVGKLIGIEMLTASAADTNAVGGRQYDFDNVQLNEVPEPASIGLLAVVAGPLLMRRRRTALA